MKIFSNFDTTLRRKALEEYQWEYGIDNVLCFWRSILYKFYKVALPTFLYTALLVLSALFFYRQLDSIYSVYINIFVFLLYAAAMFPVLGKYIDYKMDFVVVIPNSIIMYEQWGLFRRNMITISVQSIRAISIKKDWLFYSIFDNGDILILTQWDTETDSEVVLRWIPRPDKRRNQIVKIIGIDVKANQNPDF